MRILVACWSKRRVVRMLGKPRALVGYLGSWRDAFVVVGKEEEEGE